ANRGSLAIELEDALDCGFILKFTAIEHPFPHADGFEHAGELHAVGDADAGHALRQGGDAGMHARTNEEVARPDDPFDLVLIVLWRDETHTRAEFRWQRLPNLPAGLGIA